ncbi:MAG: metalloregulator ArsR/SmtB family transcription factor [Candidatus Caldatribacteriota bacterium]|nr:metalloregulator ArsR/SmtB family transcription factor [Candidatus Caldatribacteriota bacterium]
MKSYYKIFQALSDETRLRIYSLLLHGELCVCELEAILKMEQSRISHGLRILKEADLVVSNRVGKWKIYSINKKNKNNKIIQALKEEIKLSVKEENNLEKYKKENIRNKMKCSV